MFRVQNKLSNRPCHCRHVILFEKARSKQRSKHRVRHKIKFLSNNLRMVKIAKWGIMSCRRDWSYIWKFSKLCGAFCTPDSISWLSKKVNIVFRTILFLYIWQFADYSLPFDFTVKSNGYAKICRKVLHWGTLLLFWFEDLHPTKLQFVIMNNHTPMASDTELHTFTE